MQAHWKAIQWALIVAVAAFIVAVMMGEYMIMYAVLVSALIFGAVYMIAVAQFRDRPDAESRKKPT